MWLGRGKKVHMGFIDPAKAVGSEEEVLVVFRSVRDQILEKIPQLLRENES
jgi:arsenate reductase